jgi:hypothetical protein
VKAGVDQHPNAVEGVIVVRIAAVAMAVIALVASATGAAAAVGGATSATCGGLWQAVPTVDHSTQSGEIDTLNSVAARSSTDQWAVGSWTKYPEDYHFHTLVEHWDGAVAGWTSVPSPNLSVDTALYGVTALAFDNVWAVGGAVFEPYQGVVEHWDGTSWSIVPSASFPGILYGIVALGPNNIWAVGTRSYPGPMLIEHWDGNSWTASYQLVAGRFGGNLRSITALGPNDIWATGYYWGAGRVEYTLTMHFNGHVWRQVQSPSPLTAFEEDQNWLTSVTAAAPNDVWAAGFDRGADSPQTSTAGRTLITHWNGTRWSIVPSPDPSSTNGNALWGITAVSASNVWAVGINGGVLDTYSSSTPLVAQWNGSTWTQASAAGSGGLFSVAAEPGGAGISAVGDAVKPAVPYDYIGTLAEHRCPA